MIFFGDSYIIALLGGIRMKIKDNFLLRKVADSYVVVPVGKLTLDFNGIITLNETGAFLFEQLQKGAEREDLIENLLKEYDVDPEKAAAVNEEFLVQVKDADVLEHTGQNRR